MPENRAFIQWALLDLLSVDDARRLVTECTDHYNNTRLHSAIGYVAPKGKLEGRDTRIFSERDRKLAEARERRKQLRQAQREQPQCQCHRSTSNQPLLLR